MKSSNTNPALVFNCHYNGLSIIQELGRHGVQVFALDSTRSVGTVSRYAEFWRCPDPLKDEEGFINFLLDRGRIFKVPPVLFPTNDHWVTAIAKHKVHLERYYIPCVADWSVVELLVRKDKFYPWAMERGYPVPKLYPIDELMKAESDVYPVIAKPKYRRLSGQGREGDKGNIVKRLDENRMVVLESNSALHRFLSANEDLLPYLIFQEYVPGMADRMYTVGIYADRNHDVLGIFTGRKVRGFPPDIGDCVVGQAEKLPSELVTLVKKMVKDLHYHGIAEFEFKKDPRNGEFRLIEINPRSWSWIGITPACDVSLPWIAYADLTGIEKVLCKESVVDQGDVKYIKILEDFWNCKHSYKKSGFPAYQMSMMQWWKSLRAKKKICAEFCYDDPIVGLYSLVTFTKEVAAAFFSRWHGRSRWGGK